MWTLPEAPEVIGSFASLLGGVAAVWGVCVAHIGLETWRRQRDSDLSGRLAAAMFEYRESLHAIRFDFVTTDDTERFPDIEDKTQVDDRLRLARWRNSRQQRAALERLIAEADIRWRGQAKPCYDTIVKMEEWLGLSVLRLGTLNARAAQDSEFLRNKQITNETWTSRLDERTPEILKLNRIVAGSDNDETGTEIALAFCPLEDLLRKMS